MKVLLDTCAILWAILEPKKLSRKSMDLFLKKDVFFYVSPISCAEIACAVDRKRIVLDRHWKLWFREFVGQNQWHTIDISLPIIEEAYCLPGDFHEDPSDRMIVATARLHQCHVMTGDQKILSYPHVDTIW